MEDEEVEPQDVHDDGQNNPKPQGKMNNRRMPIIPGETIYKGVCNVRIHELSQPKRWFLFYTYKNYQHLFESERAQAVKEKVQELFGMTPEEAELYFNKIRQKRPSRKVDMRFLRQQIRRERKAARREALCILVTILKKAMTYAYRHQPPLLVTPMLRMVSDHMLVLLAELHGIDVPKRSNCDNISTFLISLADWCALFVSNIYYELEVQARQDAKQRLDEAAIPCSDTSSSSSNTDKSNEEKDINLDTFGEDGGGDRTEDDELQQQPEE